MYFSRQSHLHAQQEERALAIARIASDVFGISCYREFSHFLLYVMARRESHCLQKTKPIPSPCPQPHLSYVPRLTGCLSINRRQR